VDYDNDAAVSLSQRQHSCDRLAQRVDIDAIRVQLSQHSPAHIIGTGNQLTVGQSIYGPTHGHGAPHDHVLGKAALTYSIAVHFKFPFCAFTRIAIRNAP
jgi:hypothetical protein